eukprot:TRINITY_DN3969_c0_g1_i2.p1 TRINITY_DN3969_c0_g1~~TRINITY_DN3969_c0_g1_i2.p1  ORF type:complete len:979 (-),score=179.17 TRINITY_DN3969_c0_g1_i2:1355-4198(-)
MAAEQDGLVKQLNAQGRNLSLASRSITDLLPAKKAASLSSEPTVGTFPAPSVILKPDWVQKHLTVIPALIVALFDFTHDLESKDLDTETLKQLEIIRLNRNGHQTRILAALVVNEPSDALEERAQSLKRHMLGDRQVTLLQLSDRQSVHKLARLIWEMCVLTCKDAGERTKKRMSTRMHPGMLGRMFFKQAFFAEMRGDAHAAGKHYGKAHYQLRSCLGAYAASEVRSLAELVSFKIGSLSISQGQSAEAVEHLQQHIQTFRILLQGDDAAELAQWLARQYTVFGELLEISAQKSVGDGWLNPGFHFLSAASQLRQAQQHSSYLMDLLSKAYDQYKRRNASKTLLYIASIMADEYFQAKEYAQALQFSSRIAKNYRRDKWWAILTSVLLLSRECALQLKQTGEFVEYSLELITSQMSVPLSQKQEYQEILENLLAGSADTPVPRFEQVAEIAVDFDHPFIQVTAAWDSGTVSTASRARLRVGIVVNAPLPITFSECSVVFNDVCYNKRIDTSESDQRLTVQAGTPTELVFDLDSPVEVTLEVVSVTLRWGSAAHGVAFRTELGSGLGVFVRRQSVMALLPTDMTFDDSLPDLRKVRFVHPSPKLGITVVHTPPELVGISSSAQIVLSAGDEAIVSGSVMLTCSNLSDGPSPVLSDDSGQPVQEFAVGEIALGSSKSFAINMCVDEPAQCQLAVRVHYKTATRKAIAEAGAALPFVHPFDVNVLVFDAHRRVIVDSQVAVGVPFFVSVEVRGAPTPHIVQLVEAPLVQPDNSALRLLFTSRSVRADSRAMRMGDCHTVLFQLQADEPRRDMPIGSIAVKWQVDGVEAVQLVELPCVNAVTTPFEMTVYAPPEGVLGNTFTVTLNVSNKTAQPQQFTAALGESDSFLMAGGRLNTFFVAPREQHTLSFSLLPVITGQLVLPDLRVRSKRFDKDIAEPRTQTILVLPQRV